MAKMKTNRAAAKRFKVTAKKKVKRFKAYSNHRVLQKGNRQLKQLHKPALVHESMMKRVKAMLPYEF